jgi:tetratricopeptide (TPR) repeat protein
MHFAMNSALMRGDGSTALATADQYRAAYGTRTESGYRLLGSATFFASGLHGEVGEVLRLPEEKNVLSNALRHYARGEAHARRGDAEAVRAEAAAIAAILRSNQSVSLGSKTAEALVQVTQHVLEGRAAMLAGNPKAAADSYFQGMKKQLAANFSFDPPLFWYPVRRSYAAALLASGEPARAREHLYATLKRWPNDPLALYALAMADEKLGDGGSAAGNLMRAKAGWAGDLTAVPLWRI